jgi:hypothetical protein
MGLLIAESRQPLGPWARDIPVTRVALQDQSAIGIIDVGMFHGE